VVTLCDSCEVRTESRFHFVVVTLCDSCEVRTESRFHFVVMTLCDSCEVRTESRFHFVLPNILAALGSGVYSASNIMFIESNSRPVCRSDNHTICKPIVYTMWDP
jgi:hypothetical protein